jgi:hypothetical protein
MADVGCGQNKVDSRHRASCLDLANSESSMRMRTAEHDSCEAPRRGEIVRITPAPGQKALILDAAKGLPDSKLCNVHDRTPAVEWLD